MRGRSQETEIGIQKRGVMNRTLRTEAALRGKPQAEKGKKVMKNMIEKSKNGVLAQAIKSENGLAEHELPIGIKHITAAMLSALRMAAILAINAFETGKQTLRTRYAALQEAVAEARAFAMLARDNLKPTFGSVYTESWDITGYVGSLSTPYSVEELLMLMLALKNFFTANPTLEVASRNVTAAQAQAVYDALSAASGAVNNQEATLIGLKTDQDAKVDAVAKALRDLINELGTLIGSMDPRWKAFGFNLPGAEETPDTVTGVIATLIGPTAIALKWDAAARAQYYRVFKKVVGVDEEFIAVGSPADLDFTLEGLPTNATVEIQISAVNDGGESQRTASVTVVTHA